MLRKLWLAVQTFARNITDRFRKVGGEAEVENRFSGLRNLAATGTRARRDLVWILITAVPVLVAVFYFDVFQKFRDWARRYGLTKWEADDSVVLLIYLALALAVFSVRRYLELRVEIRSRRKAERHKDEFLSMVSHELRTPLTTIREGVSQVNDGILGPTTEAQQEFLTIVLDDIDRLTRLINNILDMSHLEANQVAIRAEHLDMAKVIHHVASLFDPEARKKGLKLSISLSAGPLEVYADADKLLQIWSNLVRNALKFTNEGTVILEAHEQGDHVECLVRDTGIGIKPEDRPRIFVKFFQADHGPGPGEGGAGLGLPITKALVEAQGGEVFVESTPGMGSTFGFRLPKAPE